MVFARRKNIWEILWNRQHYPIGPTDGYQWRQSFLNTAFLIQKATYLRVYLQFYNYGAVLIMQMTKNNILDYTADNA